MPGPWGPPKTCGVRACAAGPCGLTLGLNMADLYVLVFVAALLISAGGVWVLCRVAPKLGLVDHPEGRKAHLRATPVIGGLGIMSGAVLAILLGLLLPNHTRTIVAGATQHIGFFAGALMLIVVGVMDDRKPIAARYKLLVQLAACALAVGLDHTIVGDVDLWIGPFQLSLGPLAGPFTILVMLTITNAVNMIDGIDGLAGGVTLAAFAIMAKALMSAGFATAPYAVAAVGALAGFMLFNFPILPGRPAKAFLGDGGSLICGFTLAYLAIDLSSLPNRVFKPSTALWFFFIPVTDCIWLYVRRTWVARAPFAAGRDHIHHLLMEYWPARTVAWVLVLASGVMAGGGYLAEREHVPANILVLSWIGAFLLYGLVTQKAWRRAWERGTHHQRMVAAAATAPVAVAVGKDDEI